MEINQNITLLSKLELISGSAAGSQLDFSKLSGRSAELDELCDFLELSPLQTALFSCVTELSFQKTVSIDTLSKHLGISSLRLVNILNEIEVLEKKGYVQKIIRQRGRKYSYNEFGYNVPHNVIEALRKRDKSLLEQSVKFDLPGFLKQVSDMVEDRQMKNLATEQLLREIDFLVSNNLDIPFVNYADLNLQDIQSKITIFCIAYARLRGMYALGLERFANSMFDDLVDQLEFTQGIAGGTHELVRKGLIKRGESDFDSEKTIALEHRAAKVLYKDYPALLMPDPAAKGATSWRSFKPKKLYYPGSLGEEIFALQKIMRPGSFSQYVRALRKNRLTGGVTAVFYGPPGTGKTETVYQLARKTGRDICMVDLSQTKSKWFGESEKRVRQIFVDYAELLKNSKREPILFINEADGLFSRRTSVGEKSMSADQTMNTMQNILLQSLEEFEGILIATTNLTGNLDKAFERRFTFKIEFPRPDIIVRKNIWKSKIPKLTDVEAAMLAEKFDLTGGEIDIQVRKVLLSTVLDRNVEIAALLERNCRKYHGFSEKRRVGY